jgi:hypothetical protein
MDQRSIVVFLHLKRLSAKVKAKAKAKVKAKAKDVRTELVQVFGSDSIAYSIVTKYFQNDVILQNEQEAEDKGSNGRSKFLDYR